MGICFPDSNTSAWKKPLGSGTKVIPRMQILDLFCLGRDHQNTDHTGGLKVIVRSESTALILTCVKTGKEAIHNLNSPEYCRKCILLSL